MSLLKYCASYLFIIPYSAGTGQVQFAGRALFSAVRGSPAELSGLFLAVIDGYMHHYELHGVAEADFYGVGASGSADNRSAIDQ